LKPQTNHHFSEDEEEEDEDEAGLRNISLPDIASVIEEVDEKEKPKFLKVEDSKGEDLSQHFDKNFIVVERVLSTTMIFPIIHPRQAR
jgi:hypothetical protein